MGKTREQVLAELEAVTGGMHRGTALANARITIRCAVKTADTEIAKRLFLEAATLVATRPLDTIALLDTVEQDREPVAYALANACKRGIEKYIDCIDRDTWRTIRDAEDIEKLWGVA